MRLSKQAVAWLICVLLLPLAACDLAYPAATGRFERTLQVAGAVDLEVTTGSGTIDVRSGSTPVVEVRGEIQARNDWTVKAEDKVKYLEANPPIEQVGSVIKVGQIADSAYRNNVSISYEIMVPAQTQLHARTGSGSVRIDDVHGPVDVSTGSGSVSVFGIKDGVKGHTGSGSIEIDRIVGRTDVSTGSGSIRARDISGPITAKTGSGSMVLEQASGGYEGDLDIEASTGSGEIEIAGVHGGLRASTGSGGITASGFPAGDWRLSASSGHVTLRLDPNSAFDLYAHAGSGVISVDYPVTVMGNMSKHEIRGKVRGGGNLIDVRTGSGGITIR